MRDWLRLMGNHSKGNSGTSASLLLLWRDPNSGQKIIFGVRAAHTGDQEARMRQQNQYKRRIQLEVRCSGEFTSFPGAQFCWPITETSSQQSYFYENDRRTGSHQHKRELPTSPLSFLAVSWGRICATLPSVSSHSIPSFE